MVICASPFAEALELDYIVSHSSSSLEKLRLLILVLTSAGRLLWIFLNYRVLFYIQVAIYHVLGRQETCQLMRILLWQTLRIISGRPSRLKSFHIRHFIRREIDLQSVEVCNLILSSIFPSFPLELS